MTLANPNTHGVSYVEWSAVFAGAVLACAVSLVLIQFGSTLNLNTDQLRYTDHLSWGNVLAIQLWLLWVQLMASMAGGYIAGRMRGTWGTGGHESEIRDGAHGLLVWATSTVIAVAGAAIAAYFATIATRNGLSMNRGVMIAPDVMHRSGVIMGFGAVASAIVSGLAAWGMAVLGGDHRDQGIDATAYISFRKKRL